MPNYCTNLLEVTGPDKDKFYEDVKGPDDEFTFSSLIPIPNFKEITKEEYINLFTDEEKKFNIFGTVPNMDEYSFCVIKWGTKWEPIDLVTDHYDDMLSYQFYTAWSPPENWLRTISKKYDLCFELTSYEEGCDFYIYLSIDNGEEILYENITFSEKVKETIIENSNYEKIKREFIAKLSDIEEDDREIDEIDELYSLTNQLYSNFGEYQINQYFQLLRNSYYKLKKIVRNRQLKIKLRKFFDYYYRKTHIYKELIEFHITPPIGNKLLKNGGALYNEYQKSFYGNYNTKR